MIYQGESIQVALLEHQIAQLTFNLQNESVNKLDLKTSRELGEALSAIEGAIQADPGVRGLLVTSAKSVFIVGADVTEFGPVFAEGADAVESHIAGNKATFNRLENLPVPTVAAINGYALGGGLELALACDFRVMSSAAKIGLPEVKLGLLPGWGGTVRLPRLAGLDTAIEWIASGGEQRPDAALKARVVDGVVDPDALTGSALKVLERAIAGDLDYSSRRTQKQAPLKHNDIEGLLAFESAKVFVKAQAGRNYPAPIKAIEVMQEGAKCDSEAAGKIETAGFVALAQTSQAEALLGLFLADQFIGKKAKKWEKAAGDKVTQAGVLGAGIMGGGIAYQSAYKGIPVKMKDIAQQGLDLGLGEAAKLLQKRVEKGRMSVADMAATLNRIGATLNYSEFSDVDLVVEAVVENPKVKSAVLKECESVVNDSTILCSNTSTISIDLLAESLSRPEQFCGMHFFNPVHAMPLVEVIRGRKTSDLTIAKTVAYANALGKKAIVVNDCPGFLVNRVLFPYFAGFSLLLRDGADFQAIDKVMERWGWPMGPAYLLDVVGIDTGVHAQGVMAQGFPERMSKTFEQATDILFANDRLGQKNRKGFYNYELDKKGKQIKVAAPEVMDLLAPHMAAAKTFDDEEVIARMMVPMATELARCLEEGIVETPYEADMALVYGLGFPPFRGGVFRWLDRVGMVNFIEMAKPFASLGALYEPTEGMQEMANQQTKYYPQ